MPRTLIPTPAKPGSRPLSRGDLRLLLLSLIEQQPRHGYELIRLVGDMFAGVYKPSAGTVYPILSQLEAQGWIAAQADGERKQYRATPTGLAQLGQQRDELNAAVRRVHARARDIAKANLPPPVRDALGQLKLALVAHHGQWTNDDAARVAQVLSDAAAAIQPGRSRPA